MIANDLKSKKKICIFGFSYKKNTSDTRLSQSAFIINYLSQRFRVTVHDPKVSEEGFQLEMEAQGFMEDKENENTIEYCGNDYLRATKDADSIVVMTEWDTFNKYDYSEIRCGMNNCPSLYDLRAYLDLGSIKKEGFKVFRLGSGI